MRSGMRKLSEVARYIRQPAGIVSTGWPAVAVRLALFGIPFDLWQEGAGRLILAKRADGIYAAGVGGVVISIPRQVGKTYLVGWIIFALCSLFPNMTVIWTAHHTRTSNETFGKMRAMARKAKVAPYIDAVRAANGEQAIVFKNGSRILFGARDQGFGLGFDKVDILVLDEGQRVKEVAMADMVPATNAAPNGLVFLMGTPPRPTDNGEVFTARRKDALDGDPDTLYIELSADPGAKIIDWEQVAKANPSYPHRTSKTAILRMQKMLGSDEGFYREGYGIWDDPTESKIFPAGVWGRQGREARTLVWPVLAVDIQTGLQRSASFVVAGGVDDGTQIHLTRYESNGQWSEQFIADTARQIMADRGLDSVVVDGYAENELLIGALEYAGVNVVKLKRADMANGAVALTDGLINGEVWHTSDPVLDRAVVVAAKRVYNDALFIWSSTKSAGDITALRAATAAWWVLKSRDADYDPGDSFF